MQLVTKMDVKVNIIKYTKMSFICKYSSYKKIIYYFGTKKKYFQIS